MTTLALDKSLTTVINIFRVEPEQQQGSIAAIKEFLSVVKIQPGFVLANLHQNRDGVKVANYVRWSGRSAFEAFRANQEVQQQASKLFEFDTLDSHVDEIVTSESKVGSQKMNEGEYIAHFAEFSMSPKNQPHTIALAREHIKPAMERSGLISATFHRSSDETRVINYGQWTDKNAIAMLTKQPEFGKEKPYWDGIAENEDRLGRVVHTVNA